MFIDDVINFLSRLAFGVSTGLVLTGIAPCMFLIRGSAAFAAWPGRAAIAVSRPAD
jgi:hypothetical protein